ncbi:thioredoxin family protein [Swaminathania salitolerans]|uniref:Thioredoxin domain-containing protein n=1 Tax=Swaminathania salitolerans TaxID=182838 RepID=A0A511BPM1_9PROT|nr:thioredoxin family protein [Swaminathania salitolerans]GBQ11057.1 protein disulfide isomerase [Swaminathania salitolerans LMG 21291]GEL02286.1 hypothetical protein SSA02_14490 [Swaminathania salitolerans]
MLHRKLGILASLGIALSGMTSLAGAAPAGDNPPSPPVLDSDTSIAPARDVYPDVALAKTQVSEAFKTAAQSHRKVLLDFGGNWCPDCRMLAGVFNQPSVNQWLESQFVIVPVNVGHIDRNLDLARQYGVTITEVPTVLIVTAGGKLLNPDGTTTLGHARAMSPQAVLTLLDQWNRRN